MYYNKMETDPREKVKYYLTNIFKKYSEKNNVECLETLPNHIERGIFNQSLLLADRMSILKRWDILEFSEIYKDICNKVLTNLDPESYVSNEHLIKKVIDGEIEPNKLAIMTPPELFPEKWEKLIQEKLNREKLKYEVSNLAQTDFYKCPKCKKARAAFYHVQLRSADEPTSTLLNCLECGHNWRIG